MKAEDWAEIVDQLSRACQRVDQGPARVWKTPEGLQKFSNRNLGELGSMLMIYLKARQNAYWAFVEASDREEAERCAIAELNGVQVAVPSWESPENIRRWFRENRGTTLSNSTTTRKRRTRSGRKSGAGS